MKGKAVNVERKSDWHYLVFSYTGKPEKFSDYKKAMKRGRVLANQYGRNVTRVERVEIETTVITTSQTLRGRNENR